MEPPKSGDSALKEEQKVVRILDDRLLINYLILIYILTLIEYLNKSLDYCSQ